ncbi:MAG: putative DNA-binding protein [Lactococcus sp.]
MYFVTRKLSLSQFFWYNRRMEIEKTNRMNALFEFYATLLTEKQMNYVELYYADDYSLAEIAEEYHISRQAVYDNIKRTEKVLETYETKLHMYSDYIVREQIFADLLAKYANDAYLVDQITILQSLENE